MSRPFTVRVDVFAAVANPVRRRIVAMLGKGETPVGDLVRAFEMTPPALSQHLRVLRRARLVRQRRRGRARVYQLDPRPLYQLQDWLNKHGKPAKA